VKYANDLVVLGKVEAVLQGVYESLAETGRCYRMEMQVEKSNLIRIASQSSAIQNIVDQKQPENVEYFSCLGSMITNGARWACEVKSRNS
jgi:hypothetical protein